MINKIELEYITDHIEKKILTKLEKMLNIIRNEVGTELKEDILQNVILRVQLNFDSEIKLLVYEEVKAQKEIKLISN